MMQIRSELASLRAIDSDSLSEIERFKHLEKMRYNETALRKYRRKFSSLLEYIAYEQKKRMLLSFVKISD